MNKFYQEVFVGTIREYRKLYGTERSPDWRKTRNAYVEVFPFCAVCENEKGNHVHHVVPFHVDPRLELDFSNLITLCPECHFMLGHLNWWQAWNPNIILDSRIWNEKIRNRSTK